MFCRIHQKINPTQFQRLVSILVNRTLVPDQPYSFVCSASVETKRPFPNFCTNYSKNINSDVITSNDVVDPENKLDLDDTFNPKIYKLMTILDCNYLEASKLYRDLLMPNKNPDDIDLQSVKKTVNYLKRIGSTVKGILTNPEIFSISIGSV